MARGPEHDFGALGSASRGMRCQIIRTQVGFCFYNSPHSTNAAIVVYEMHAEKFAGDSQGVPGIECKIQLIQWITVC